MTRDPRTASTIVDVAGIPWEPSGPGIQIKPLWRDHETERRLLLLRVGAGARMPHRHGGDTVTMLLEGAVSDERGTAGPGDVVHHPQGSAHTAWTDHGATLLALLTGDSEPESTSAGSPARIVRPHELPWKDARPGMHVKGVWADPAEWPRLGFMRFDPGARFLPHRHEGEELIFVLEGSVSDEDGTVTAGDVAVRPVGCEHTVWSEGGATLLVFAWGPVQMDARSGRRPMTPA